MNDLKYKIKELAEINKPKEICGLIFKSGDLIDIYPCQNISLNKEKHFELNPFDYLKAVEKGKIIGIYHSQENSEPSFLDYSVSLGHNLYSLIYSYKDKNFIEINKDSIKYRKYIGIPFDINKENCFTLSQKFYLNEYNIKINNYFISEDWFEKNPNIINNNYDKEGFLPVELNKIQIGDAIIFRFKNSGIHIGIYIGSNMFLHHDRNKYSNIEYLHDTWKEKILFCLRHKTLFKNEN